MSKEAKAATAEAEAAPIADKASAGAAGDKAGAQGDTKAREERTYTQADLDRIADKIAERHRKEAEDRIKTLETDAEKKRLEEQGKWQEVAEKERAEKEALLADKRHNDFLARAREKLNEKQLSKFEAVLFTPADTVEKVAEKAAAIDKMIADEVDARVAARLNTGNRPAASSATINGNDWSKYTPEQWKAKKAELGIS